MLFIAWWRALGIKDQLTHHNIDFANNIDNISKENKPKALYKNEQIKNTNQYETIINSKELPESLNYETISLTQQSQNTPNNQRRKVKVVEIIPTKIPHHESK